jgi:diguanylate cyclase (GGDEF)-like protein
VTDLAARVSGDEFAILLDHVSEDDAHQRIGALVNAVAGDPVHVGQKDLSVRLSWGITMIRADDSVDVAMGRADAAMYSARLAQRSDR